MFLIEMYMPRTADRHPPWNKVFETFDGADAARCLQKLVDSENRLGVKYRMRYVKKG